EWSTDSTTAWEFWLRRVVNSDSRRRRAATVRRLPRGATKRKRAQSSTAAGGITSWAPRQSAAQRRPGSAIPCPPQMLQQYSLKSREFFGGSSTLSPFG